MSSGKKNYVTIPILFLLFFLSGIPFRASAQDIFLKSETLHPPANATEWASQSQRKQAAGTEQVLVQFHNLPDATQKMLLEIHGVRLLAYVPDNAYIAVMTGSITNETIAATGIRSILKMETAWKKDIAVSAAAKGTSGQVDVKVSFYKDIVTEEEIIKAIGAAKGSVTAKSKAGLAMYTVRIPAERLNELAGWYATAYVQPATEDVPLNAEAKATVKGNILATENGMPGFGLDGEGVVVGVGDNVSGNFHVDLKDRIVNYNPQAYTNHGVHINGIVGGAGIMKPEGRGMAPKAKLINHYYSEVVDQTQAMRETYNMTITNNSYAANVGDCRAAGSYDINSQEVDEIALQHKDVLHVFAAGNDGKLNCQPYPAGFGTVTGGYQPAKNNIVVTSTDKKFVNAIDGSRGPVRDGRLKPEITAVGVDVLSTTRNEDYLVAGGTSMACPSVAGGLALLTERYRQLYGNVNPPADVLKAIMLNGATDIGNAGPDYRFGFGFMNLLRSRIILEEKRYEIQTVNNGEEKYTSINVPAGTAALKVMLCWYDVPASPATAKQLVNDLDLEVATITNTIHRPLVLKTVPKDILENAAEGEDHINNTEQVVIDNPAAGPYVIKVKGFKIPSGTQDYVISYDFVPAATVITNPYAGASVKAGERLIVYWDTHDRSSIFTLEYSTDNGNSWNVIDKNIPSSQYYYIWEVPKGINSSYCQLRLSGSTSGLFTISDQPKVQLKASQCPGYINIQWDTVANATAYEVLKKSGPEMVVVDTVTTPSYSYSGLALDSFYFVAVRPLLANGRGYRSEAVKRKPDTGDCEDAASDGDLMVQAVVSPRGGRALTSTALLPNDTLSLLLRNLDDVPQNYYLLSYSINNSPWTATIYNTPIPANNTWQIDIPGLDFSAVGTYTLRVAIQNYLMPDPQRRNDTITRVFRHVANDPIDLAGIFLDDFEAMEAVDIITDSFALSPNGHWDYINHSDTGQLRSFVNPRITIAGERSISMDAVQYTRTASQNEFRGTFNLDNYHAKTDEVRLDFEYIVHGQITQPMGNDVWVRGSDTAKWQKLFNYRSNILDIGKVQRSGSLSLTDALLLATQDFTSSAQIGFGQNEVTVIGDRDFGKGLTLDNVRLYSVQNDAQLVRVVSPEPLSCGLPNAAPLTVQVFNGVNQDLENVEIFYQVDKGEVVREVIPSIKGKQVVSYTFKTPMTIPEYKIYNINIWLSASGDTYRNNDSILNYSFRNQPKIVDFPYKEDFEAGPGGWYADGVNSSWEHGTPASEKINMAASGTKAWKTNLDGQYNNNEIAYLYGPCFNIAGLTNPVLRFKIAYDIEHCGMIYCDAAYMEYSLDGTIWTRLGIWSDGTNWYNDTAYNIWSMKDNAMWHEASITLPKVQEIMRLRYVFTSDPGGTYDGIAIDDVEVFDRIFKVPDPRLISMYPNPNRDGKLFITWEAYTGTEMEIAITDMTGKNVYTTRVQASGEYNETQIQTPVLQSGMYLAHIRIGERRYVQKLIYQRN